MTLPNASRTPIQWDEKSLAWHAQTALEEFVARRVAEPIERYTEHVRSRRQAIKRLIRLLSSTSAATPDPEVVRGILLDPELQAALRYVAGPPISADDLAVLVARSTQRLSKRRIEADTHLATEILALICKLADPTRFPWLQQKRKPRPSELKQAVRATAVLHASQTMQTERRAYGRVVERRLRDRLVAAGFTHLPASNGGKILAPAHMPTPHAFFGECTVQGRRTDLLIGLSDGRAVAIEAKDSSSVVNSVKRVLNDTAAKARHWRNKFGETVVPVALLSGVFGLDSLKSAQASGLYLVWAHDLDGFMNWVLAQ